MRDRDAERKNNLQLLLGVGFSPPIASLRLLVYSTSAHIHPNVLRIEGTKISHPVPHAPTVSYPIPLAMHTISDVAAFEFPKNWDEEFRALN